MDEALNFKFHGKEFHITQEALKKHPKLALCDKLEEN